MMHPPDPTISDETFEWLFQPRTAGELMCRLFGIEWFEGVCYAALTDDSPGAMPWRFRHVPYAQVREIVIREKVYQEEKLRREAAAGGDFG